MQKLLLVTLLLFFTCGLAVGQSDEDFILFHIHGLAYSNDGKRLYVPRHYGLAVYEDKAWKAHPGPQHDYMGFVGTRDRFYTSGHPAEGSDLVNPFGLMRSDDSGKTWTRLGMMGEADFHFMTASYNTNWIYLLNLAPNSRIPFEGLASTADDGKSFRQSAARGAPRIFALAAHPAKPEQVAVGGEGGLFISTNRGDDFHAVQQRRGVYSLWYDLNGEELWYGGVHFSPFLEVMNLKSRESKIVELPPIERDDAVANIVQNPQRQDEFVVATFQRHVFITQDRGQSWEQLAEFGVAK